VIEMTKCETCNRAANDFDGYCDYCRKMQRTKQAALTLLADEETVFKIAVAICEQHDKKCGYGGLDFKAELEQAIRKAANLGEKDE
jgi:hypothetical protein